MTPDEIRQIVEKVFSNTIISYWLYLISSVALALISIYIYSYLKSKSSNLATKQDVADITREIESVKAEIQKNVEIEKYKRDLKFKAILKSLKLIDSWFSNTLEQDGKKSVKQYATTVEARECHNELILTCDREQLVNLFLTIMFSTDNEKSPTQLLNLYRNEARKELNFGEYFELNKDIAWFGSYAFEKPLQI